MVIQKSQTFLTNLKPIEDKIRAKSLETLENSQLDEGLLEVFEKPQKKKLVDFKDNF